METEKKQEPAVENNGAVQTNIDYWKEAVDFSKTLIVDDIEKRFADHCIERKFNHNERMFFQKLLAGAIEFNFTIARLKHFDNNR